MRRLHELITRRDCEKVAVIDHDGCSFSYAELHDLQVTLKEQLQRYGIRPGDRVVLLAENCVSYIVAVLALSRLDALAIPLNARLTYAEIVQIMEHAKARCVIVTPNVSSDAHDRAEAFGAKPIGALTSGPIAASALRAEEPEPVRADDNHIALLMYTSGTTGAPKGVMLSHGNLLFSIPVGARFRAIEADDVVLGFLPCTHIFGLSSVVMAPLFRGAQLVLMPRFDVDSTLEFLERGVTVLPAVQQTYIALLDRLRKRGGSLDHRLRLAYASGAPMDPTVKKTVEEIFCVPLHNGYGLTEAAPSVAATSLKAPRSDVSVGTALPGVEVKIDAPNEAGVGEILVRGPNVTKGYFREPDATRAAFDQDGFLKTGDLGKMGPDGALYIVGRLKELIIRSGFNVYPPEVEATLIAHPSVELAAVVGQTRGGNEEVVAFVTTSAPISETDLKTWCRQRLVAYKVPSYVLIVQALPQTATGKILKHKVLQEFSGSLAAVGTARDH